MFFSKLTTYLYLLSFFLLLQNVYGDYTCLSSTNFTAKDPYDSNLIELTTYLTYQTPITGFSLGSKGRGPDKVYGLSMCMGATYSPEGCRMCIIDMSTRIQSLCPFSKGATISYKGCLFKYLNEDFFGQLEVSNQFYIGNSENVSDPIFYGEKIMELLNNLTVEAYATPKMSETRSIVIREKENLVGLTQCTRDISSMECRKCLDDAIKFLPQCCGFKKQVTVYGGSCIVAYGVNI